MTNLLDEVKRALEPFAEVARLEELHGSTIGHRDVKDSHLSAVDFRDGENLALSIRGPSMGDFRRARSALAALEAAPPPSPLVEKLKKLANYLDEKHEYEAVELIDCAVDRLSGAALEAAGSEPRVTDKLITDLEAIPLADMTEQDQRTFAAAIGQLRRLSDRVHMLEIRQHRREAATGDDVVERVARAIYEADCENNSPDMWEMERNVVLDLFRKYARAAIAAMGVK